jgi:phosphoglycolate phosphatase-like HAD superfamily hydrolase
MKPKNLIVFDMDGVIVDVSASYRDVVRRTTQLFFHPARASASLPEPLFALSDLAAVKQSGGLNNDWDLTFAVINLLFSLVKQSKAGQSRDPWTRYRQTMSRCDVKALSKFLTSTDDPLKSLLNQRGKLEDEFIADFYSGDVGSGNIIKQIFQDIYLGPALFKSTYHLEPEIYREE